MEKDVAIKEKKEKKNKAFKPVNLLFRDDLVTFHNVLFFFNGWWTCERHITNVKEDESPD